MQQTIAGDNQKVVVPGEDDIIGSEIQILTSLDLAEEAVTNIGASNILFRPWPLPTFSAARICCNVFQKPAFVSFG